MGQALLAALYVYGVPALFCLVPLAMPGWRTLALVGAAGAMLLGMSWAQLWSRLSDPAFEGSAAGAVALIFLLVTTAAFAAGTGGRAAGIALQQRGASRREVVWTDLAAVSVPAAIFALLALAD